MSRLVCEACHKPGADGIDGVEHDDRDRCCCPFGVGNNAVDRDYDHIDVQPNERVHDPRDALRSPFPPSLLEGDVPSLHVAQVAQPVTKRLEQHPGRIWKGPPDDADLWDLRDRLGLGAKRSGEEHRTRPSEECPPVNHSITRSARSSTDCGTVRPNARAVLRLITSSNLAGRSNGRSPGRAPLRILSTYVAASRYPSAKLGE
jgi:hypothetical protein